MACCKGRAQRARQNGEHCLVSSGRTMLWLVCCLIVGVARTWRSWRTRAPVCCNAEDGERSVRSSRKSSDLAPLPLPQEERKEPSLVRCVCIWGGGQGSVCCFAFGSFNPSPMLLIVGGRDWTASNQMVLYLPSLAQDSSWRLSGLNFRDMWITSTHKNRAEGIRVISLLCSSDFPSS